MTRKRYKGCIANGLRDFTPKNDSFESYIALNELQAYAMQSKMKGLNVTLNHNEHDVVGKVLGSEITNDGRWLIEFEFDEDDCLLHDLYAAGKYNGLSLSHYNNTLEPIEIGLCWKGARKDTGLISDIVSLDANKSLTDSENITHSTESNLNNHKSISNDCSYIVNSKDSTLNNKIIQASSDLYKMSTQSIPAEQPVQSESKIDKPVEQPNEIKLQDDVDPLKDIFEDESVHKLLKIADLDENDKSKVASRMMSLVKMVRENQDQTQKLNHTLAEQKKLNERLQNANKQDKATFMKALATLPGMTTTPQDQCTLEALCESNQLDDLMTTSFAKNLVSCTDKLRQDYKLWEEQKQKQPTLQEQQREDHYKAFLALQRPSIMPSTSYANYKPDNLVNASSTYTNKRTYEQMHNTPNTFDQKIYNRFPNVDPEIAELLANAPTSTEFARQYGTSVNKRQI